MKLIKDNIELFIMYGFIAVFCFFFACGDTIIVEPSPDPGPPPPPGIECSFELEPNNYFTDANFMGVLPILAPESICGDVFIFPPHDADFYYFYLTAPSFVENIPISIAVTTDLHTTPKIGLFQTVYDGFGQPTEDYILLGQFVQGPGLLFIDEFLVPFNSYTNNDLYIVVEAFSGVPYHFAEYELEYWNN